MDHLVNAPSTAGPVPGSPGSGATAPDSFLLRRLVAERLTEKHLPVLLRMHSDERLMTSIGGVRSDEQTADYLDRNLKHWSEYGFGLWILLDPVTHEALGRAGLRQLTIQGMVEVELAYALFPEFWGRGLATDAARACVTIGRDWLGLHSVVGLVLPANLASQRVLRKAALTQEREVLHAGRPHLLFRTD